MNLDCSILRVNPEIVEQLVKYIDKVPFLENIFMEYFAYLGIFLNIACELCLRKNVWICLLLG